MSENPTIDDYLDETDQPTGRPEEGWDAPPDTAPQCRYCGQEFDESGHWLNRHEAHCEADGDG
jgi:hypothetical protein